jgi:hypothetical protein
MPLLWRGGAEDGFKRRPLLRQPNQDNAWAAVRRCGTGPSRTAGPSQPRNRFSDARLLIAVCTENLNASVLVVKSTKDAA